MNAYNKAGKDGGIDAGSKKKKNSTNPTIVKELESIAEILLGVKIFVAKNILYLGSCYGISYLI